jgi:anti-anti-sigma factor
MTEAKLIEAGDAFTVVAVRGRLDPDGVGAVEAKLTAETVARGKAAVIDLVEVDFIGSIGIGMLIGICRSMRAHRLGVAVVATALVKDVLDRLSIGDLFPVVATRDEALQALKLK